MSARAACLSFLHIDDLSKFIAHLDSGRRVSSQTVAFFDQNWHSISFPILSNNAYTSLSIKLPVSPIKKVNFSRDCKSKYKSNTDLPPLDIKLF